MRFLCTIADDFCYPYIKETKYTQFERGHV
mgnify:CR=1 FL=1|jgi:hypothetical protein